MTAVIDVPEEIVKLADLKDHPRNYRDHPQDQLDHIKASIQLHGMYRNIVIARDRTILAGHGVVQAAKQLGLEEVPARRVDVDADSIQALQILTGDNEIDHLGMIDDRMLTELLKEIKDFDADALLGTGYDEMMIANLAYVTRPKSEIEDFDAAAEWVGMPDYHEGDGSPLKLIVSFENEEDRAKFVRDIDLRIDKREARTWTTRYPFTERDDLASLRFAG